ncbi:beta-galactoside alpha-2,6-sialyltransferase 2-like isoform X1 [Gadus chalcogrammus]|uniref:beta-galactoside alpha-2,6-sialyltransferase 2-like isoform X1 n=1 Tax=Gadus chalcogrammus TaxID=1042646 RepID=UPI0024C3D69C|nr:beta-galactoside alpha-2,6-sialyltransferase 2-like isoform X1 [Gadus chalcogrammus]
MVYIHLHQMVLEGPPQHCVLCRWLHHHQPRNPLLLSPPPTLPTQIMALHKHHFNSSFLYRNVTLVAWDPAPYSLNLSEWYENPDFDLFTSYVRWRQDRPDQPFYILHPAYLWRLWDVIQSNTQENIQPNPPSSGFIGQALCCRSAQVEELLGGQGHSKLTPSTGHRHGFHRRPGAGGGHCVPLINRPTVIQTSNTDL